MRKLRSNKDKLIVALLVVAGSSIILDILTLLPIELGNMFLEGALSSLALAASLDFTAGTAASLFLLTKWKPA